MQPSVNQIASTYRGNPAPLQQRVQRDKQANQGLPADLKELLALQILTEERDSAGRQQAIQQLQQQTQQPTVAQSLQQRAQQAIQARSVQDQRQQQGIQGLMQRAASAAVPAGTPQPSRQPQGLDELPSNMGEFAAGGIVAFAEGGKSDKYETPYDRMNRKNREASEDASPLDAEAQKALEASQRSSDRGAMLGTLKKLAAAGYDVATLIPRAAMGVTEDLSNTRLGRALGVDFQLPASAYGGDRASMTPMMDRVQREGATTPSRAPAPTPARAAPFEQATLRQMEAKMVPVEAGLPSALPKAPPSPTGAMPPRPTAPRPTAAAPAPAPSGVVTSQQTNPRLRELNEAMNLDPDVAAKARQAAYRSEVGAPETAGLTQLAQELQDRRAKMQERNRNIDPLVENLKAIASAPRGQKWMYSLLSGSDTVEKARQGREAQDFEMLKQIVEQQNKIADVNRGFKSELFSIGDKERTRVYKDALDAAKEMGLDDRAAAQLAQEAVLKREQMVNSERIAKINQGPENQAIAMKQRALSLMDRARKLEATGKPEDLAVATRLKAEANDILTVTGRTGSPTERGATPTDRLRAAQSILEDIDSTPQEKAAARIEITNIMSGMKAGAGAPAGRAAVPDAAVQALRKNPGLAAQFDQKYGVGAAAQYMQK